MSEPIKVIKNTADYPVWVRLEMPGEFVCSGFVRPGETLQLTPATQNGTFKFMWDEQPIEP